MMRMKIGERYWWKKGWRWLWYLGQDEAGRHVFEDAGDRVMKLTERDVELLELTGWRDEK
jgi:hypothetical protein